MSDDQKDLNEQNEINEVENIHADCEKQLIEYKSGWQRALADYQNLKKETQDKRTEWARLSEWQILEEVIPVYDNFKKAFSHKPENEDKQWNNWSDGIGFIMKQFSDILKNHKIEEIQTAGNVFDPSRHEAVGEEEFDAPEGTVIREVDAGYIMDGKVLKPAKVVVAKKSINN